MASFSRVLRLNAKMPSYKVVFACKVTNVGMIQLRAHSRFAPSQWETVLLCNDLSHWLGASLEPASPAVCNQKRDYIEKKQNVCKYYAVNISLVICSKCSSNIYMYDYLIPPGQNGRHFADDIFRCILVNEKFGILVKQITEVFS